MTIETRTHDETEIRAVLAEVAAAIENERLLALAQQAALDGVQEVVLDDEAIVLLHGQDRQRILGRYAALPRGWTVRRPPRCHFRRIIPGRERHPGTAGLASNVFI